MKYLFPIVLIFSLFLSCHKSGEGEVGIRVINQSGIEFSEFEFLVTTNELNGEDLLFTNLEDGKSSDYQYVNRLEYLYYDESRETIYVSNSFKGISGNNEMYGAGFGFCGTGLFTESTKEGNFSVIITGVDEENKSMFIDQVID